MAVLPEYQSQGIGTKLLKQVAEWAKEQGIDRLHVSAATGNTRGIEFYKRFGFKDSEVALEMDL